MLLFLCVLLNLCCGRKECECACVGGCKRKVMGLELICPGPVLLLFRIRPPTFSVPAWNVCLFSTQEASDSAQYCIFTWIAASSIVTISSISECTWDSQLAWASFHILCYTLHLLIQTTEPLHQLLFPPVLLFLKRHTGWACYLANSCAVAVSSSLFTVPIKCLFSRNVLLSPPPPLRLSAPDCRHQRSEPYVYNDNPHCSHTPH